MPAELRRRRLLNGATHKISSAAVRALRCVRLILHVVRAVVIAGALFPFLDNAHRALHVRRWSSGLLAILAVRVRTSGNPPRATGVPAMIVANHVSWLDIFAINTVHPMRFVAKSEIRHWPVIGWICEKGGTVFIDRSRRRHIAEVNVSVAAAMERGDIFAVFPEGFISTGDRVLPFHASLLQPALACEADLYPVAIRYTRADGSLCNEADYEGAKSLLDSFLLILTQPVIHAHLQFLPPLAGKGAHRRDIAEEAASVIARALNVPAPQRRTEKSSRPQA